jgi:PAS domain S-box-containing protein
MKGMENIKDQDRKKIILCLRWTVIIVTSYLVLFEKGRITDLDLGHLFVLLYIFSNVILTFLPRAYFSNSKLLYLLIILDTGTLSLGMYLSERMTTDFYLVFFLILIFASMSRNFKLLMAISGATAFLYGFVLYSWGLLDSEYSVSYTLRIPFIFIMSLFYGYIVQTFTKESQQQLAISEDKYRGLFENANEGIIILRNSQHQISDVNREAERVTGYKKDELLRKGVFSLFSSEEKAVDYLEEVMKRGEGRTDSLSLLRKDGRVIEVDLSIKRIDLGEDTFLQMIFTDLMDQRKLERKIRESKRSLQAIFDGIWDRVSMQGLDYQVLRVNKAVIEEYKTTYQELLGRKCYEAYYQRDFPCEKCPMTVTIGTKQPASTTMKISEKEITLRIFSYPILDEKENLVSVIEYTEDITEEQRLQEQLIRSEKLAGLGILISGITHEINNPLGGIMGMAEFGLGEADPSKIKEYLGDILSCGRKIEEIVKGLSSFSRMAKGEDEILVDINEVLENCLKMVRITKKLSRVEVTKRFQPVEKIKANAGEIQLIFNHLITNAFQAMDGKEGKLTLSTRSLQNSIEVKVSDSGTGIPQKDLNKIFDPFFTTRKFGEGKGLGLNTVYRLVTKYDGRIDGESKEDIGTTFTIQFPIRRGP